MRTNDVGMMTRLTARIRIRPIHYDKTRMKLNFEIGPDGKVHPLGYQEKSLEVRLQERLAELGWKPFIDIFCPLFDFRTSLEIAVICTLVQIYGLGSKCHLKCTVMIASAGWESSSVRLSREIA